MREALIHGAGGFGREVAWLLTQLCEPRWRIRSFVEDGFGAHIGSTIRGVGVVAYDDLGDDDAGCDVFVAIGSPTARRSIVERYRSSGVPTPRAVAGDVQLDSTVRVDDGVIICRGVITTVDTFIGEHAHINLDCTIGHDVVIGAYATLAPGVHVSGNVHVGPMVYVGTGAVIINGQEGSPIRIGEGSVVAAGATVTSDVPPGVLVAGVPAVVKKRLEA